VHQEVSLFVHLRSVEAHSKAAAFFVTYETLKKHAPKLSSSLTTSSSMTHLLAATGGELVWPPSFEFPVNADR
jgi:hypothetical protein